MRIVFDPLTLIITVLTVLLLITIAYGHEAPSGFQYPSDCCGGSDCRPIVCSTIKDNPDGSVNWLGLFFAREQVKMSGDAMCHVCVSYNTANHNRYPHCIFLSPTM